MDFGIIFDDEWNHDINIEIDDLTPCLIDVSTDKHVSTHYKMLKRTISRDSFREWSFDWSRTQRDGYIIFMLFVDGDPSVQGLISLKIIANCVRVDIVESAPHNRGPSKRFEGVGGHLFAIACKYSFEHGCMLIFIQKQI